MRIKKAAQKKTCIRLLAKGRQPLLQLHPYLGLGPRLVACLAYSEHMAQIFVTYKIVYQALAAVTVAHLFHGADTDINTGK